MRNIFVENDRDYFIDPWIIKRFVDGKYRTFNVIHTSYDHETGFMELFEVDDKESYHSTFVDGQFKDIKKIKYISWEEHLNS